MRSHTQLMPQLCTVPHLYRAYRKALRGSGQTAEALAFGFRLEYELLQLRDELATQSYQPAAYRHFQIREPKVRTISVAPFRDRVVHHAVVALLEPVFEAVFIEHSYATRTGKGTHRAVRQAQRYLCRYPWFFKADVDGYFASIDQEILMGLIARKVQDADLLRLIQRILANGGTGGKGLPIGNLTSQFFANVYLDPFDHFVKEGLGIKGYVRYMDDFVVFAPEKQQARNCRHLLADYLHERLALALNPRASFLNQRCNGLHFLGTRIFPRHIRVHPVNLRRTEKRILARLRAYASGKLTDSELSQCLSSHWGHLAQYDTRALRQDWRAATAIGQATAEAPTG